MSSSARDPSSSSTVAPPAFSAFVGGCVHVPIVLYPQLYFVSELVMSGETRTLREHFDVGMSKYYTNTDQLRSEKPTTSFESPLQESASKCPDPPRTALRRSPPVRKEPVSTEKR